MTPFGEKIRGLRKERAITQSKMADDLAISAAYLSALEHGHRGRPGPGFILQIADYFDLIWDDSEDLKRLASLSHPRVVVDTSGLSPKATELANLLSEAIQDFDEDTLDWILDEIKSRQMHKARTDKGGGGPTY